MTISRFDNTFFLLCIDDFNTINFYNMIAVLRHASFLKFVKYFNFSDSYVCFFDESGFVNLLKIYLSHIKSNANDGTNMLLGYVYNGLFVNVFNTNLIENILLKHNYFLYFENFFVQLVFVIIKFLEIFVFFIIDSFFLFIENSILDF